MKRASSAFRAVIVAAAVSAIGAGAALAQMNEPPADVPGGASAESATAALVLRIDRLESELRQATGAIEQLQNQQRRLEDQLKRYQEDVEFRLGGGRGTPPAADASSPPVSSPQASSPPVKPIKKSDAFDPSADPNAVGAPRQIGTTAPSAPLGKTATPVGAPLDLSHNASPGAAETPTVIAGLGGQATDGPREEYNAALETFRLGQYEQAEQQMRGFVAKNGGSRLVPDAIFYIGETFFQRSRPREAAEQYLKLSTDYAKSARAPEALLRLGQSLAALGSNDQACATFGEVAKRYPNAAASVRKNAEREMQKDHC